MTIHTNKAAITEFEEMVKAEYEAKGFKLKDTVRMRTGVVGKEVKFPVIRGGIATQKAPQDMVKPMNLDYLRPTATLTDWTASELTDIFSQAEINFDEKKETSQQVSRSIGRRSDQIILDSLEASTTTKTIAHGSAGMTYEKFIEAYELLDDDAVDIEDRFILIPPRATTQLLKEEEFINSDFIANRVLNNSSALDGQQVLGFNFKIIPNMREGGLPQTGNIVTCYAFQKMAVGMGTGIDFRVDITYENLFTSWLVNGVFKAGAVAIDNLGIVKIDIDITK